jgi:hypothetical protein
MMGRATLLVVFNTIVTLVVLIYTSTIPPRQLAAYVRVLWEVDSAYAFTNAKPATTKMKQAKHRAKYVRQDGLKLSSGNRRAQNVLKVLTKTRAANRRAKIAWLANIWIPPEAFIGKLFIIYFYIIYYSPCLTVFTFSLLITIEVSIANQAPTKIQKDHKPHFANRADGENIKITPAESHAKTVIKASLRTNMPLLIALTVRPDCTEKIAKQSNLMLLKFHSVTSIVNSQTTAHVFRPFSSQAVLIIITRRMVNAPSRFAKLDLWQ